MQLIPSTARRFGVENPWDVKQNIEGGVKYLKYLNTLFPNDLKLTLAAYNAGEAAVWKYGNSVPPYRETVDYVKKVGSRYRQAVQEAQKKHAAEKPEDVVALATASNEPVYEPIQTFVDAAGRVHIRTKTYTP
jgi:soluble lytic murein transglycosylase-like protein